MNGKASPGMHKWMKGCREIRRHEPLVGTTSWMNLEIIILRERSQPNKVHVVWFINVKAKNVQTNLPWQKLGHLLLREGVGSGWKRLGEKNYSHKESFGGVACIYHIYYSDSFMEIVYISQCCQILHFIYLQHIVC